MCHSHKPYVNPAIGGLLQIAHRHSFLLTTPLIPYYYSVLCAPHKTFSTDDQLATWAIAGIAWFMTGRLAKTVSLVALNIAHVPPLEE